jgi:glycosyltransferase involved in cell wall biosynthesis
MTVVIPSYEPTERLLAVVDSLTGTGYPIVLVDDGSGETHRHLFDAAEARGCVVLRHDINRGKGTALKTAFAWLAEHNPTECFVCADSDGQHRAEDIAKIADAINPKAREMVLGARTFKEAAPFKSRLGNRVTRFVFHAATRVYVFDTQTGLRGYPPSLLPWLCSVEGERFEYELNLLLRAKQADISIREVRIQTIYEDKNKGTHFRAFRDSAMVYRCIWRYIRKR